MCGFGIAGSLAGSRALRCKLGAVLGQCQPSLGQCTFNGCQMCCPLICQMCCQVRACFGCFGCFGCHRGIPPVGVVCVQVACATHTYVTLRSDCSCATGQMF